ncbi:MAG: LysM peptidoglycan-binding domain-containing protein [Leucobacter sp.]|nr:LysM peptidoglycan-binding domain-containing protein [Leucobacter sp.]
MNGARTRLRLTRRGRVVFGSLIAVFVTAVFAVTAMFGGAQAVASDEAVTTDFGYVVVQPGDSLWQLAGNIDPSVDPRDLVAEIVRLNSLGGSGVQAGQPIAVPLRYADAPGVMSAAELGL